MTVLRALVVGCGDMGVRYDLGRPAAVRPWTHAFGYAAHTGFDLVGLVDPDAGRRADAETALGVRSSADLADTLATLRPDVVSIAAPSQVRLPLVEAALASGVRAIFCEKPLALTGDEAAVMVETCRAAGVLLACNYSRRWEPGCRAVATLIASGAIGRVTLIDGRYARGLANTASHLLDLTHWWVGGPLVVRAVSGAQGESPNVTLNVGSHGVDLRLAAVPAGAFDLFELDVFGTEGLLRLSAGGSRIVLHKRKRFGLATSRPVHVLDAGSDVPTDADTTMLAALDNVHAAVTRGEPLACSGQDGLTVSLVFDAVAALQATAR